MSEYVDYFALLTQAGTLADLRGQIAAAVDDAMVIAVPPDASTGDPFATDLAAAEAIWADLDKPVWVVIAAPDPNEETNFAALAGVGPVVRVFVQEDGERWKLDTLVEGERWAVVMADMRWGDRWLPAVDEALMRLGPQGGGAGPGPLARTLGLEPDAIRATMVMDGAVSFRALTGIPDIYLFDQSVFHPETGAGVVFDFEMGPF